MKPNEEYHQNLSTQATETTQVTQHSEAALSPGDQLPSIPASVTSAMLDQPANPSSLENPDEPLQEYRFEEGGAISEIDMHMSEGFLTIVRIPLMSEMRIELEALIRRRGWEWQDGLVNVLASGISQLSAQDRENTPAAEEAARSAGQAKLDPVTQELAYYHAMYSAMKFRAFSLLEKLKVLEMRESGLKGKLLLDEKWAEATRQQLESLQAENLQLKQRLAELGDDAVTPAAYSAPHGIPENDTGGGLLGKLQAFVSRQSAGEPL